MLKFTFTQIASAYLISMRFACSFGSYKKVEGIASSIEQVVRRDTSFDVCILKLCQRLVIRAIDVTGLVFAVPKRGSIWVSLNLSYFLNVHCFVLNICVRAYVHIAGKYRYRLGIAENGIGCREFFIQVSWALGRSRARNGIY